MSSRFLRALACTAVASATALGTIGPALAAEPVQIDADETLEDPTGSTFTSTIDGCESGTVANGDFRLAGSRRFGIFNGFKVFECADGGGFVVRLVAKFDDTGSTGSWAIVDGWGGFEDLHGSGTLVGHPTPTGINDIYEGTLRP